MKTLSIPLIATLFAAASTIPVGATSYDVTVDGPDAIFLAGRTDVVIPDPSLPWITGTFLIRHEGPTPEEAKEQLPPSIPVSEGDIVRALDPAVGDVNFFNGTGAPRYGPGGNGVGGSNLNPLGGISGYKGPQGPLVGVFLDDSIPSGSPPSTLDFSPEGMGTDFLVLAPALGQVFYIGDGKTSGGVFHQFTAPAGATRLFLGIPDGLLSREAQVITTTMTAATRFALESTKSRRFPMVEQAVCYLPAGSARSPGSGAAQAGPEHSW